MRFILSIIAYVKLKKQKNNFSKRVKGTTKTLNNITKDDLIKHHKNSFNTKELYIGVSGDISEESIKKYIEKVFGKFSDENVGPSFEKFTDLPRGQKVIQLETPQSSVVFGHPGLSRSDKDYFSLRLANYILGGGGFQSRLYKQIREKRGLVYSIYSYPISYKHDGFMMGGFQTRNKSVFETVNRVKEEWAKISKRGITKKELDEAKAYYKGSFTRNFTSTVSIANLLNIVQFYDLGENYFSERDKIIENLKLDDINNMRMPPMMMANGGAVGSVSSSSSGESSADVGGVNIEINMNDSGSAEVNASTGGGGKQNEAKEFAKKVKEVVVGVIAEEKRVSGSLFTRRK